VVADAAARLAWETRRGLLELVRPELEARALLVLLVARAARES
jgi:hypothetical protein